MNKIYWDRDKISIITDQIEAIPHKHWGKIKDFMYVHFGRKIMNYNVGKMRKSYGKF